MKRGGGLAFASAFLTAQNPFFALPSPPPLCTATSHSSFATSAQVNFFPLRVDVDKADNANLVISRSGLIDKGKKEGVGSARGNRHDTLLSAIQQRDLNLSLEKVQMQDKSSCIPSSQKNPKRRPSTSVTTNAEVAALTTPQGPSFGLTVESASHDDSTEIAGDDKVSRNTTLVVDSREGEGCRRLKENSERLQGEMGVVWGVGGGRDNGEISLMSGFAKSVCIALKPFVTCISPPLLPGFPQTPRIDHCWCRCQGRGPSLFPGELPTP